MNLKELKDILQILEEKEIAEFELEEEGLKLRIRKAPSSNHASPSAPSVRVDSPPSSVPTEPPAVAAVSDGAAEEELAVLKSPIVGTFYRSPDPNSPPFVSVGDKVQVGQVLCIVEAMKLMNEIEAEVPGEIIRIHHESGQSIQYGEPLFSIRPDR